MVWIWAVKAAVRLHGPPGRFQTSRHVESELTPAMCRLLLRDMRLVEMSIETPERDAPRACHEESIEYVRSRPRARLWTGFALGDATDPDDRCWRLHSWVVEGRTIREMTGLRRRSYVGAPLDTVDKFLTFFRLSQEDGVLRRLAREPVPVIDLLSTATAEGHDVRVSEPRFLVVRKLVQERLIVLEEHAFPKGMRLAYALSPEGRSRYEDLTAMLNAFVRA